MYVNDVNNLGVNNLSIKYRWINNLCLKVWMDKCLETL